MSCDRQWHVERSKKILQNYPEIKAYFGNYPLSIIFILALGILQWSVAYLVKDLSWWLIGLISLLIGQFILHSLAVFVHETAHNLILKGKFGSAISLFLIELGSLSFGQSLIYVGIHSKSYHRYLNDYDQDYECWDKKQSHFLTKNSAWRIGEALFHLLPGGIALTDLVMAQMIPFFNTGFHDEHHTFANDAWIHLSKLEKIAPEYFTNENPYSYEEIWWLWAKSMFAPACFNRYTIEKNEQNQQIILVDV